MYELLHWLMRTDGDHFVFHYELEFSIILSSGLLCS